MNKSYRYFYKEALSIANKHMRIRTLASSEIQAKPQWNITMYSLKMVTIKRQAIISVTGMLGNWKPHSLLVRESNAVATLDNLATSWKLIITLPSPYQLCYQMSTQGN